MKVVKSIDWLLVGQSILSVSSIRWVGEGKRRIKYDKQVAELVENLKENKEKEIEGGEERKTWMRKKMKIKASEG